MRGTAAATCLALLLLAPVAAGGGSERLVLPISLEFGSLALPADVRALDSTGRAVRGLSAVLAKDFGLPMPSQVTVYLYAGRRAFQEGLVRDARVAPALAAELSDLTIGIGLQREVLLNDGWRAWTDLERLRLLAHELTHVSQIELAGGEERGERWLAEGMAEWVAYAVLERLGLDTMDRRRDVATDVLRAHATLVRGRLDLGLLGTPRGFTRWYLREGAVPTYQLAFLLTDHLIARDGLGRVRDYFASFSTSSDRRTNFRRAFGQTIGEFEREVLASLRAAAGESPGGAAAAADAPVHAGLDTGLRAPQSR